MQLVCPHCHQMLQFSGKRPAFCAYCGKALPSPAEDPTLGFEGTDAGATAAADGDDPAEIGGYRLLRMLGEGGMGRVYEAEEIAAGRRVALKLISADFAGSSAAVERFRREGRLASGVSHPRCVFVLAADEAGGRPYIVMELMPGLTLQDLVDKEGPLPVDKALLKILDVMEGLREAHRLGVVHRDVKPSNCFLEADGRVKIGDFGLSKSLVTSDALTRTGAFIGTPLFASPEQIKGGVVGPQSDVYSVAATLYCLLTGRAPFQGGDPAATLARIVSDPAPSMRSLRRDLPAALDQAVLRGLERDPAKRWRDLDEFQTALAPFVSGRLSIGGLGVRFGAFLLDYLVMILLGLPMYMATIALTGGGSPWDPEIRMDRQLAQLAAGLLLWALYFGGCEALWGCTPGKRWLGLRVCKAQGGEKPGIGAVALRTFLLYLLISSGALALQGLMLSGQFDPATHDPQVQIRQSVLVMVTLYPVEIVGLVLLFCTMRARNGYRGLHEILSGTRVVQLPSAVRARTLLGRDLAMATSSPEGLPARIGPFDVLGQLPSSGSSRLLLGHDASLGRRAWIWLRPVEDAPIGAARRDLTRTTRLRWLAGGRQERMPSEQITAAAPSPPDGPKAEWQWDAFMAPTGALLADVTASLGFLSWGETRRMLSLLTDELIAAEADGTLPATLSAEQVWIRPDGQPCLLDAPVGSVADPVGASPLAFLGRTAVLALGAKPVKGKRGHTILGVPLARHAVAILDRLIGTGKPYTKVQDFQAALKAAAEKPAETTRLRRLAHLAVLTAFLSFGLCSGVGPVLFFPPMMVVISTFQTRELETTRERLAEAAAQDADDAANEEDPIRRQMALANVQEDARLTAGLDAELDREQRERQARYNALGWLGRQYADAVKKQIEDTEKQQGKMGFSIGRGSNPAFVRAMASSSIQNAPNEQVTNALAAVQTVTLTFWPVVWVLWAFVTRGGLSFLIMGLTLVRRDGRPALRIQCLWRALLVWLPPIGLAAVSLWLAASYWATWNGDGSNAWMLLAASVAWWAALAMAPLYVALALWFPKRSLHDVLAGTYLVPR